jgi:hypothetical protein
LYEKLKKWIFIFETFDHNVRTKLGHMH